MSYITTLLFPRIPGPPSRETDVDRYMYIQMHLVVISGTTVLLYINKHSFQWNLYDMYVLMYVHTPM